MKKVLTILLSVSMLMLGGCGSKAETATTAKTAAASATETTTKTATTKAASTPAIDRIKAAGVLKVATSPYVPHAYQDPKTNELIGHDIDLAKMIAQDLGVKVQFTDMTFTSMIPSVQNGQADMAIAAMYDTPARREVVNMSDSYMDTGMVLVTMKNASYKTLADLNGKKVGVKTGATSLKVAQEAKEKNGYTYEIVEYTDTTGCIADLEAGRIDAVVNDLLNQLGLNQTHPNVQIAGDPFTQSSLSIAINKKDTDLLDFVNKELSDMKSNGKRQELYDKWILGTTLPQK